MPALVSSGVSTEEVSRRNDECKSSNLINGLFVFMLAAFIGFEVIRRVSPLLHTPLMSLTNALDAIAVVGAIVLAGEHKSRLSARLAPRGGRRHQQHRGRISDHRSHAEDVQDQPSDQTMNDSAGTQPIIEIIYLVATALFILSLKWMSSPSHCPARRLGRRNRHAPGHRRDAAAPRHRRLQVDCDRAGARTIIGVPLGIVQMTAVPQRTALSHAFGAFCVTLVGTAEFYLRSPDGPAFHDGSSVHWKSFSASLTFTGSLMAAGKLQEVLPQRPITYKGQNIVNLLLLAIAVAGAGYLVMHPEREATIPADGRDSAALRSADDHPDRRGGYADGDLAAELLCRAFGGGNGICA